VIAFDFQEALSFEGETGPYLQYAAVRVMCWEQAAAAGGGGRATPELLRLLRAVAWRVAAGRAAHRSLELVIEHALAASAASRQRAEVAHAAGGGQPGGDIAWAPQRAPAFGPQWLLLRACALQAAWTVRGAAAAVAEAGAHGATGAALIAQRALLDGRNEQP
jgi:hypothetical protein